MKNTIDYFLEDYYFKPSAIVSHSLVPFDGINTTQHLRLVLAELGDLLFNLPSQFVVYTQYITMMDNCSINCMKLV